MKRNAPPPRFRIRLDDGSELPISTVEALARRLSRGEVLPDTPLFDAGTGAWARAGDTQVVRFILEQMVEEGAEVPAGWPSGGGLAAGGLGAGSVPELGSGPGLTGIEHIGEDALGDPAGEVTAISSSGPLDFGFTLADLPQDMPGGKTAATPAEDPLSPDVPKVPLASEAPRLAAEEDWMTPSSSGGLMSVESTISRPWGGRADREKDEEETEPLDWDQHFAKSATAERRRRVGFLVIGAAGSLLGIWVTYGDWWGAEGGDTEGGVLVEGSAGAVGAPVDPGPVPAGLEVQVQLALVRFDSGIQGAVDSLREVHALPEAPPDGWLGGYYLANARDFPQVREFWLSYEDFVRALRERDRPLLQSALVEGSSAAAYLTARYEARVRLRQDRYDQLILAATRAVQFHDFLVANADGFRFTPARGAAIPADPVLEVETVGPALRTQMNNGLDGVLSALDRSRGGADLPSAGLGRDLFSGFGDL